MENCDMWADVCHFHEKFDIPQTEMSSFLPKDMMQFRVEFLKEEVEEFVDAYMTDNVYKAFDALIDLVYVALGTAYMMNLPWNVGWQHVQDANMRKERAKTVAESKRGTTIDVVKPEGWVAPDDLLVIEILKLRHEVFLKRFFELQRKKEEEAKREENKDIVSDRPVD